MHYKENVFGFFHLSNLSYEDVCVHTSLKGTSKNSSNFEGKTSEQQLLGEKHKRVEDWTCCIRETELGNV